MNTQSGPRLVASLALGASLLFASSFPAHAQVFDSGSTGVDGALVLNTPGSMDFDPASFDPPLDSDGDGVYHFTTIEVASGTTVNFRSSILGHRPVVWKASGDVTISGILNLDGQPGHGTISGTATPAEPGPGGFEGGLGSTLTHGLTSGLGPGGGTPGDTTDSNTRRGGGGSYGAEGGTGSYPDSVGAVYGNIFLLPLVGGSGGSGGGSVSVTGNRGTGGGAGGGAFLIASSGQLSLTGTIYARGGNGGWNNTLHGGAGSGGAVRLVAQSISGTGSVNVSGGTTQYGLGHGGRGRIRIEAHTDNFTGSTTSGARFATPGAPLDSPEQPSVRVARVAGVDVPADPQAVFAPADLTIDQSGEVTLEIEANGVPLGTTVRLTMVSEDAENGQVVVDSTPLAGALEASTATAQMTIPPGFSRFTVRASWAP